jgi:benzoyl-CoA reductase subunit B
MTRMIDKYEYLRRTDALCDLIITATSSGAPTLEVLMANLPPLPEYHASLLPQIFPEFINSMLKPKNCKTMHAFGVAMKHYMAEFNQGMEEGKPLVDYFPCMTTEVLYSMGLNPISYEVIAILLTAAFIDGVEPELEMSEAQGFPVHVCGMQRAPVAALEKGLLPRPEVIIKTSAPCNSSNLVYQYAFEKLGIPTLILDSPYHNEDAVEYFTQEVKNVYADLQGMFNCEIDYDQLRERIGRSNEQLKYLYELQELRKLKPCPDPGMHRALDLGVLNMAGINEHFVNYMKVCYEEAKYRVDNNISLVPEGKKEIRTLWTWGLTAHMLPFYDWLEDEYGATYTECGITYFPAEHVGFIDPTDYDSIMKGLALRTFHYPMGRQAMGDSDVYVDDMVKIAKEYQADAAVFSGNQSCKHAWTAAKRISDSLMDEVGIPSLTWETDLIDKRFTSHAASKALLSEFFTTFE